MTLDDLSLLPNIDSQMKQNLISVGIGSPEKLKEIGSIAAFKLLKFAGLRPNFDSVCELEGAIRGVRWFDIPKRDIDELIQEIR